MNVVIAGNHDFPIIDHMGLICKLIIANVRAGNTLYIRASGPGIPVRGVDEFAYHMARALGGQVQLVHSTKTWDRERMIAKMCDQFHLFFRSLDQTGGTANLLHFAIALDRQDVTTYHNDPTSEAGIHIIEL